MGGKGTCLYLLMAVALASACGDDGNQQMSLQDAGVVDPDGGGDDGGDDAMIMPGATAPVFGGVSHAYANNAGEVTLVWFEATDDTTPHDAIRYLIYVGPDPDTVAQTVDSMGTATVVVTGMTTTVLTGLTPDTPISIIAIAEDVDAQRSANRDAANITPTSVQAVIKKAPKVLADLGITVTELGVDSFRVSGGSVDTLAVGDLVIVESQFGRSLREITMISGTGTMRDLTTTRASLGEVFESGSLRTTATLVETQQPVAMALNPGHHAGERAQDRGPRPAFICGNRGSRSGGTALL